jgi:hypothetical protein
MQKQEIYISHDNKYLDERLLGFDALYSLVDTKFSNELAATNIKLA